jgi:hypothetical protein
VARAVIDDTHSFFVAQHRPNKKIPLSAFVDNSITLSGLKVGVRGLRSGPPPSRDPSGITGAYALEPNGGSRVTIERVAASSSHHTPAVTDLPY